MAKPQSRDGALAAHSRTNPFPANLHALAGKASDQVSQLSILMKAYLAVERFVTPDRLEDGRDEVKPSRTELSALLRALNGEMEREINSLADTTTVLRASISSELPRARAALE